MDDKSLIIFKMNVLWCLMFMVLPAANSNYCHETYDHFECTYNMICTDTLNPMRSWSEYRRGQNNQDDTDFCISKSYNWNGYMMDPIYLTYKTLLNEDYLDDMSLPSYSSDGEEVKNIIFSLDLSKNGFSRIPTIQQMENLVVLNMSYNLISTAKLSNKIHLSLKVIDLSHNFISSIEKYSDEVAYNALETINLSFNYLQQVPASIFDSFRDLTFLDLSHNSIDTINPFTFEGMKKLAHLNMSDNQLSDINASLFRFTELRTLDLSNNNIKHVKENDFNTLEYLTHLNLKCNLIKSIDKETFANLHWLQNLDISDNQMDTLDKDIFKNVKSLNTIIISKNKFKALPKSLFKGKSIQSFSIVENKLEGSIERGIFEGLQLVLELDLSNQCLESIENNAFYGLGNLKVLLLQNNNINTLSTKCFNMLIYLKQLDLSYNKITNIDFEKDNLGNLESLSLRNNYLTVVKHEHFHGLDSLQFLDLSDNKISRLESNSFQSLKNLVTFEISNNPLNGTLEENTFEGLNSLPSLDISCTLLTAIQNGSFNGMTQLKDLNISRSNIETLQFNSFAHTGALETLDLSYNKIAVFKVNNTQSSNLRKLYLSNNYIKIIDDQTFENVQQLTTIILSHNQIQRIDTFAFKTQSNLLVLDVSFNSNLMFDMTLIKNNTSLHTLNLSGTKPGMSFGEVQNVPLSVIEISNASILDVKVLMLNGSKHLVRLVLSNNKISKIDVGCFTNVTILNTLDLSHNQITYIQPGAFKDNTMLYSLNISHNYLTSVSYGIFRGVSNLNTLDISYNSINTLQNERFYEVSSLSVLVADHNKIETLSREEFLGTSLEVLSIGDNPIPCDSLVAFAQNPVTFRITAINLEEKNHENVNGVTCNKHKSTPYKSADVISYPADDKNTDAILVNIRDILLNKLASTSKHNDITEIKDENLANISSKIVIGTNDNKNILMNLTNLTSEMVTIYEKQLSKLTEQTSQGNMLLEKILKLMINNSIKRPTTPAPITKDNATYDNLVIYINKLKEQLEDTIAYEKNKILNEVDIKLSTNNKEIQPVNEKLSASPQPDSKSIFTETCVGLILLILVCFVLYKFYKSGMFVRRSLSISTRELPDAMDSAL